MRRIINRSGPPRFPIPNASIFITILNWLGLMFYSSRSAYICFKMHGSLLYDLEPMPRAGQDLQSPLIRLLLLAAGCTLIKKRRSAVTRLLSSISCGLWRRMRALLVGGVKTAAFPDRQKLSGPPHSRRRQPRTRIPHDPNARHYSRL